MTAPVQAHSLDIDPAVVPGVWERWVDVSTWPEDDPDTCDSNMRYEHDCTRRRWVIGLPASRAGDHVEFRAAMPLLVALSVCPLESGDCNGGRSTPVRVEVYGTPG